MDLRLGDQPGRTSNPKPLKKKHLQDFKRQDEKWGESLFWDLTVVTTEAQAELVAAQE